MSHSPTLVGNVLGRFFRHQSGNVAMLFGLMLLPMLGAVGLAIDFGMILTARTKAQVAADAAALQASGVARDLIKLSDGGEASTTAAIAEAKTRAEKLFKVHAEQSGLENYRPTVSVVRTGQIIRTTVSYTVGTSTYIAKLFNNASFTASGSAVSSSSLPSYSDVYLALDISSSMGIAATQAEMVKLFNARGRKTDGSTHPTGCVFGCHVPEYGFVKSFSAIARENGVRLRIDVLRDAVQNLITTAENDAEAAPIYRIALYTLGASANASTWSLNQLHALSNNFGSLHSAAGAIDIAPPPTDPALRQKQTSYINEQLAYAAPMLPRSDDGTSHANSKKYIFLITDGVRDVPSEFGSCITPPGSIRCVNGIDSNVCKAYKDKGITVGVLYTTYVPVAADPANPSGPPEYWFDREMLKTGAYAKVAPALQRCASTGWFFEASDATGIEAAMKRMFEQTTQAPSLTN